MVGARDLEKRMAFLPLALQREHDVVGIKVAGWPENAVGVPLHAAAQMEGVSLPVRRNIPPLRETGHDPRAAALKVNDAAVDLAVGIERRAGGVNGRIEVFRAALRAKHQRLCRDRRSGYERGDAESDQNPEFAHGALPWDMRHIPKPVSNHTSPPGSCQRPRGRPLVMHLIVKDQTPTCTEDLSPRSWAVHP